MAVISLSLFCKSDCTFFSIWQINPCSCLLSSALRAARLSACSDNRRLCAFCSLTMFLLDERSVVVVVVGFVPSFLPKMLKKPFRFGLFGLFLHTFLHNNRNLIGYLLVNRFVVHPLTGLSGTSVVPYPLKDCAHYRCALLDR